MTESEPKGGWSQAESYDWYMGRWSTLVARKFVSWLGIGPGHVWLDVGAGTGRLTAEVLRGAQPDHVTALDSSRGFLDFAERTLDHDNVNFVVGDAMCLPFDPETFDVVVSGLCLNFIRDPLRAVHEMWRVVRPGGMVASYVWDYPGHMDMVRLFWDAAIQFDPGSAQYDEGKVSPICTEMGFGGLWKDAGLDKYQMTAIEVVTPYANFDEYWQGFTLGQGVLGKYLNGLSSEQANALKQKLEELVESRFENDLQLIAKAWCIKTALICRMDNPQAKERS